MSDKALLMDPIKLSAIIVKRITELGTVTYDQLQARAVEKGIEQGIFDNAMQRVHKKRTVLVKNVKGVLTYSIKPVVVETTPDYVTWCKQHYPYTDPNCQDEQGNFLECFPDWDVSWIFLTPDELEEYNEAVRGGKVYKHKRYEYGRK